MVQLLSQMSECVDDAETVSDSGLNSDFLNLAGTCGHQPWRMLLSAEHVGCLLRQQKGSDARAQESQLHPGTHCLTDAAGRHIVTSPATQVGKYLEEDLLPGQKRPKDAVVATFKGFLVHRHRI